MGDRIMATTINADTSEGLKLTSDTSGDLELQSAGVTKAKITSSGLTNASGNPITSQSGKNLIINGNMLIAQRGTDAVVPTDFPVDRFKIVSNQAGKFTAQQSTDVPSGAGFKNSIVLTSSSAYSEASGDYFLLQHRFEGNNVEHLQYGSANAKTVTVSFWAKSSLTGTFAGALRDGGSYSTSYIFEYTISSANTWEYKTVTISGATSGTWLTGTSVGAELSFALGGGSDFDGTAGAWQSTNDFITSSANRLVNTNGATLYITGVQMEAGTTATDFENLQYGQQMQLCQRYFYSLGGTAAYEFMAHGMFVGTVNTLLRAELPVKMRSAPTLGSTGTFLTKTGNANLACASFSVDQAATQTFSFSATISGGSSTIGYATLMFANNSTAARLTFSSEL